MDAEETKKCDTCGGDLADGTCANCPATDEAKSEETTTEESAEETTA